MTKTATDLINEQEVTGNLEVDDTGEQILKTLTQQNHSLQDLYTQIDATEDQIDESVRILLTLKYVGETSDWDIYIALGGEQYLENNT